jgi:hypothetical protein
VSAECIHGIDPTWCSTCLHGPDQAEKPALLATFTARYPGHRDGCNLPITEGQTIERWSDDSYRHEGCAP